MKIVIVTAVYEIRKSRPFEFYLYPANDFLSNMADSDLKIKVFTNKKSNLFVRSCNIEICTREPESFMKSVWDDPDWKRVYSNALKNRPDDRFEEKNNPELLAIWLGKFQMMYESSEGADAVLWQDAAIRTYMFGRDAGKYTRKQISKSIYFSSIRKLMEKSSFSLLSSEKSEKYFHGVKMSKYGSNECVRAGLILARASETENLKNEVAKYWGSLVENGDYGTEENPLSIFAWNRKDVSIYSYNEWMKFLDFSPSQSPKKSMMLL